MNQFRDILYLGDDTEFLKELQKFAAGLKNVRVSNAIYRPETFFTNFMATPAHAIFVDFTQQGFESASLLRELLVLKKSAVYKSCLFISLLEDEEQLKKFSFIFSSGFQLSFIKGGELESLFRDSFYIGLGEGMPFPSYAKARNIQKELEIGICSSLTFLSSEKLMVETDLETEDDALRFELSMFPDLKNAIFKVKDRHSCAALYPMTSSFELEYPFPGAWEEESEQTIMKETVETWLSLNKSPKKGFVSVITKNIRLISELSQLQDITLQLDFSEKIGNDNFSILRTKRPDLIFYEFDDEGRGENGINNLDDLIHFIKKMESYYPIIVISRCPTGSAALQKVFSYQFITSMQGELERGMFAALTSSFINKKSSEINGRDIFIFSSSDSRREVRVRYKFTMMSLTEHEVTFISDVEIPMFSVLHFQLPMDFYVTIVPAFFKLEARAGHHYMGIIHSLNEEKKKKLRQFIYQIIYKPLDDFSEVTVAGIMDQIEHRPLPKPEDQPKEPAEVSKLVKEQADEFKLTRNFRIEGKSKL